MTKWPLALAFLAVAAVTTPSARQAPRGVLLSELTWLEAEQALTPDTVVVIPLGAAAKEHGPHLKLKNDLILSDYVTGRVLERADVVVAPTVTYHFYPAFLEYPGSTHLRRDTARDVVVDVVRSLAAYGPKRFYVLNTGISTNRALAPAADTLAADGILLRYTNLSQLLEPVERQIRQQEGGTHADEIETSMILYINPSSVDMSKAVKDYDAGGVGPLSRVKGKPDTTYSPTGIWGDPTLATREKGRLVVEALVAGVLADIEQTRVATVPPGRPRSPAAQPAPRPALAAPAPAATVATPFGTEGDRREIRGLADVFQTAWRNQDSWGVASLWTEDGHLAHADGFVERNRQEILEQRATMFMRREYRLSFHTLSFGDIRFVGPGVAVTTGRWSLYGVRSEAGKPASQAGGPCEVVFTKTPGDGWRIASFQYVQHERGAPPVPTRVLNLEWRQ